MVNDTVTKPPSRYHAHSSGAGMSVYGWCVAGQIVTGGSGGNRINMRSGLTARDTKRFSKAGRRQLTGYKESLLGVGVLDNKDFRFTAKSNAVDRR